MQVVILAGGLGTRLGHITQKVPKSMVEIQSKPFLEYQIDLLKRNQLTDIVLCVGCLSEQIKCYFEDGKQFGVHIQYSEEVDQLLGTAGPLKKAAALLDDEFMVMNGDSYLPLNYREIEEYFQNKDKLALLVVYKNYDRYERSNVIIEGDMVKAYSRKRQLPGMIYVDAGLSVMVKQTLGLIPSDCVVLQDELWAKLIKKKELLAFEVGERFYEIGSLSGLREFRLFVKQGGHRS